MNASVVIAGMATESIATQIAIHGQVLVTRDGFLAVSNIPKENFIFVMEKFGTKENGKQVYLEKANWCHHGIVTTTMRELSRITREAGGAPNTMRIQKSVMKENG